MGVSTQLQSSHFVRGTSGYRAPELLDGRFSNKVDIWAMGCILYELVVGRRAFTSGDDSVAHLLRDSRRKLTIVPDENFDPKTKRRLSNYISEMLKLEPPDRPGAYFLYEGFKTECDTSSLLTGAPSFIDIAPTGIYLRSQ